MQVSELMTRSVELIDANTTIRDAAVLMREDDAGAMPVADNGKLIGMVSDRDIVVRGVASGGASGNLTVRQVMSEGLYFCRDDHSAEEVARMMAERKVRRLPVLDAGDKLVGLVSLADLARKAGPEVAGQALQQVTEPTPNQPRQ